MGKDEFQYPDIVYGLAVMTSGCLFELEVLQNETMQQELVQNLIQLQSDQLCFAFMNKLLSSSSNEQQIIDFLMKLQTVLSKLSFNQVIVGIFRKYGDFEYVTGLLKSSELAIDKLDLARNILSVAIETRKFDLIDQLSSMEIFQGDEQTAFREYILTSRLSALRAQQITDEALRKEKTGAIIEDIKKLFTDAKDSQNELQLLMSLGWAARLHCEDVSQQFFDDMGRRAQSLINRVEDKEEKR